MHTCKVFEIEMRTSGWIERASDQKSWGFGGAPYSNNGDGGLLRDFEASRMDEQYR